MTPSQTFQGHIKELRRRILWIGLAVFISAGIAYVVRVPLISKLQSPLGAPLFYTSPAGSFNFVLKLSMIIGMFVALPVIIYQLLRFIEPALPITIRKSFMLKIIGALFLLALAGVAFGYFFMIPMSLKFFAGYSTPSIKPLISANEYLSYIMNNLILFALTFQIPLIVLFINWIKPIKPSKLLRYQRHVIVGAFGIAIVLPFTYDPISQFIVAIPIVVLFYASIIVVWIANRGKQSAKSKAQFSPALLSAETPMAQQLPAAPVSPPTLRPVFRSIDGFVQQPSKTTLEVPMQSSLIAQDSQTQPMPALRHPRLSIDGIISPKLAT